MPLDPRTLRIGVGDDKYATIVHPDQARSFRSCRPALGCPPPSIRADFDAAAYVAQFEFKSVAH